MNDVPNPPPEKPSVEPEILPPERGRKRAAGDEARVWVAGSTQGTQRIFIARPGPVSIFLAVLLLAAVAVVVLVVLLGVFLIWIPVAALIVTVLVLSALLRGPVRRR